MPLSPMSRPRSTSSPSAQSGSSDDDRYTAQIVIAVVVVVGLLLIACVIGLVVCMYLRRKPRRERTETAMIPMPVTSSPNNYNNDAFDDTASYENPASNAQASDDFQQPVAGAVGGVGTGKSDCEDTAMYETLSGDQGQR